ncbi:MAG: hypothetical protein DWG76_02345 [Chloroflexi bacterium]|nr:hypothetical protein [Chloroflexota bacterium]
MKYGPYVIGLVCLLSACGSPQVSERALGTALVEVAVERTQTVEAAPSIAVGAPQAVVEPSPIFPAAATGIGQTAPHGDGVYLVGVEIAPGLWRSTSSDRRFCYWARRKYDGIILGSYYGLPGGELLVRAGDYEVELAGCGVWVYMGPR